MGGYNISIQRNIINALIIDEEVECCHKVVNVTIENFPCTRYEMLQFFYTFPYFMRCISYSILH